MRAVPPLATRACCHLISLDITQCHDRTVPKLSQLANSERLSFPTRRGSVKVSLSRRAERECYHFCSQHCERRLHKSQCAVITTWADCLRAASKPPSTTTRCGRSV